MSKVARRTFDKFGEISYNIIFYMSFESDPINSENSQERPEYATQQLRLIRACASHEPRSVIVAFIAQNLLEGTGWSTNQAIMNNLAMHMQLPLGDSSHMQSIKNSVNHSISVIGASQLGLLERRSGEGADEVRIKDGDPDLARLSLAVSGHILHFLLGNPDLRLEDMLGKISPTEDRDTLTVRCNLFKILVDGYRNQGGSFFIKPADLARKLGLPAASVTNHKIALDTLGLISTSSEARVSISGVPLEEAPIVSGRPTLSRGVYDALKRLQAYNGTFVSMSALLEEMSKGPEAGKHVHNILNELERRELLSRIPAESISLSPEQADILEAFVVDIIDESIKLPPSTDFIENGIGYFNEILADPQMLQMLFFGPIEASDRRRQAVDRDLIDQAIISLVEKHSGITIVELAALLRLRASDGLIDPRIGRYSTWSLSKFLRRLRNEDRLTTVPGGPRGSWLWKTPGEQEASRGAEINPLLVWEEAISSTDPSRFLLGTFTTPKQGFIRVNRLPGEDDDAYFNRRRRILTTEYPIDSPQLIYGTREEIVIYLATLGLSLKEIEFAMNALKNVENPVTPMARSSLSSASNNEEDREFICINPAQLTFETQGGTPAVLRRDTRKVMDSTFARSIMRLVDAALQSSGISQTALDILQRGK